MSNDNWGWRARIGLFIVGNEAVPEAEWWAMAPPGVSVHAARVTARAPWAALARGSPRRRAGGRPAARLPPVRRHAAVGRRDRPQLEQPSGRQGLGRGGRGEPARRAGRRNDRHHQRPRHLRGAARVGMQAAVPGAAALVQRRDGGGGPALLRRSRLRAGRPSALRPGPQVARPRRRASWSARAWASSRRSSRSTPRSGRPARPMPTAC